MFESTELVKTSNKAKVSAVRDENKKVMYNIQEILELFEILIWKRIEFWWNESEVLSRNQGACKKAVSSLHSELLLQETIAYNLEHSKKIFVTFLDVSKAFDSVWTEGLFYQLRNLGVVGKLWRILYFSYLDFQCKVRIQDKLSGCYSMRCGPVGTVTFMEHFRNVWANIQK